jgi:glycosyltransferase involved in cell wall biosynthesis
MRRAEHEMARGSGAWAASSVTEGEQLRRLSGGTIGYFPTTYVRRALAELDACAAPPRIVHLGGMATTANRLGLERFLDVAWPRIRRALGRDAQLLVIGSLDSATERLRRQLLETGAATPGFVPDLSQVLRPFDLHIIPWEHDTGTRTRAPLALSYGQVLVSTRAAVRCLPELESEKNCMLVDDLAQFADVVCQLFRDPDRRTALGRAGHATFEEHFTRAAVQERFDSFIRAVSTDVR